jgi:hypothetical protein
MNYFKTWDLVICNNEIRPCDCISLYDIEKVRIWQTLKVRWVYWRFLLFKNLRWKYLFENFSLIW